MTAALIAARSTTRLMHDPIVTRSPDEAKDAALTTLAYCAEQDCKQGRITPRTYRARLLIVEKALGHPVQGVER